ncbi:UNVERIFIED_CONTAM: hypothetical protein HDU68_002704 [Siphonaria sp. JEL0065]|nr:hypothetical protein HDU68_002704 [Siphonaria sp. JEL0065]
MSSAKFGSYIASSYPTSLLPSSSFRYREDGAMEEDSPDFQAFDDATMLADLNNPTIFFIVADELGSAFSLQTNRVLAFISYVQENKKESGKNVASLRKETRRMFMLQK